MWNKVKYNDCTKLKNLIDLDNENAKQTDSEIENNYTDIFGKMSSMTKDEVKSYNNVLRKISKPTGRNLYEMM